MVLSTTWAQEIFETGVNSSNSSPLLPSPTKKILRKKEGEQEEKEVNKGKKAYPPFQSCWKYAEYKVDTQLMS